jgi:nicotinamidase/pyrazinamidase
MSEPGLNIEIETTALILVDVQNDFMPGGALGVDGGYQIVEPIRRLMDSGFFGLTIATQDWHPADHMSFASSHAGHRLMDVIDYAGHDQVLWPDHCVQGTHGAELAEGLDWNRVSAVVRKGMQPDADSYSAFRNNWNLKGERPKTGLAGYLRERGIEEVFLCGLARDVCVQWTAEDAAEAGFRVRFVWEATRPVDASSNDTVRRSLESRGVEIIDRERMDSFLDVFTLPVGER